MNNLYNYIYGILMFVILITLIEMLLPKGNNKKYVKLVSSFLLTIIVLTPIISIYANPTEINSKIEDVFSNLEVPNQEEIETINQQVYIDNLFEEGMKNDIYNIAKRIGYETDNISIEYNKNEEGQFTNIAKINLNIVSKNEENKIDEIDKVSINLKEQTNNNEDKIVINEMDKNNIIETLSDRYKIDKSNIYIN